MPLLDCFIEILTYTHYLHRYTLSTQPTFEETRKQIDEMIEMASTRRREMELDKIQWREALFAVCAFVDERILCSQWQDRNKWLHNQLQRVHFNTTNAGEEFYHRLESLDKKADEVREVFFVCLALGFTGKYYTTDTDSNREELLEQAAKTLSGKNTALKLPETLFPEGYESPASGRARRKRLPRLIHPVYILIFMLPVIGFILLYRFLDGDLDDMLYEFFISKGF